MKKLLAILALFAVSVHAATLLPIQLLNPAGSASGQFIASTGPATTPAWATLSGVGGLVAANNLSDLTNAATARANLSLGTAATATLGTLGVTVPLLSNSNVWTLGQSFTGGIIGVTNGSAAASGSVGQLLLPTTSGTSLTSGTSANAASTSLPAGDWDLQCDLSYSPAASTTITGLYASIGTASAALGGVGQVTGLDLTFQTGVGTFLNSPTWSLNIASSTTVFCVADAVFGTSTMTVSGVIHARRIH